MTKAVRSVSWTAAAWLTLVPTLALADKTPLIGVPLQWSPTEQSELSNVNPQEIAQVRVGFKPFVDHREKPDVVGENREDDKGTVLPVTTSSDVADFCRIHMTELFKQVGISVVDGAPDAWLEAEVVDFQVVERRSYVGSVRLKVEAVGKGGKALWTGFAIGDNKRWGRSYKADNYFKTLSDSLLSATVNLLNNPDFRRALKGTK